METKIRYNLIILFTVYQVLVAFLNTLQYVALLLSLNINKVEEYFICHFKNAKSFNTISYW